MRRPLLLSCLCALAALVGTHCRPQPHNAAPRTQPDEITVSAAVSLKDAFSEIGRRYEARTGTRVNFNFGASGVLQKQIEQGAPVDVFASAGAKQMDALAAQHLILPDARADFARNQLVLIVPRSQMNGAHPSLSAWLAQPALYRLAIGNPQTVPAGEYARQLLTTMKLWEQMQPRLVLAEDVRQVLDYVAREEVDAGLVYLSDVAPTDQTVFVAATAPTGSHDPIRYPIAVVKDSRHEQAARGFVAAVLSLDGQMVLQQYNFISVLMREDNGSPQNSRLRAQ